MFINYLIDSVYKIDENYYPQVFLEECKHVVKANITDEKEIFSDGSDDS